jgi:rhodanese-related sulfurtransferase
MKDFSVIEFETYLKNNQPLLLDVREQWEWDKCHFENAKLLPLKACNCIFARFSQTCTTTPNYQS